VVFIERTVGAALRGRPFVGLSVLSMRWPRVWRTRFESRAGSQGPLFQIVFQRRGGPGGAPLQYVKHTLFPFGVMGDEKIKELYVELLRRATLAATATSSVNSTGLGTCIS
jgi:hypothetical protein